MCDSLATGFEGCEKKVKVDFVGGNLRNIPRPVLDTMLDAAKCTIMSKKSNEFFDAYVLSESSLFVYPGQVIIKTCGTTMLLEALPVLMEAAKHVGSVAVHVEFSRSNFIFPALQLFPHTSFDHEVDWLNAMFNGSAHIMGPLKGARWHIYNASLSPAPCLPVRYEVTLEVMMFKLDRTVMNQFVKSSWTGAEVTRQSGIDKLIPGASIDENLFEPCGYSCNGLRGSSYMTIHITPEEHCSFVSFETNVQLNDYSDLLQRVLDTFQPGSFGVSLLVHGDHDSRSLWSWTVGKGATKWANKGTTSHHFDNGSNVTVAQFAQPDEGKCCASPRIAMVPQPIKLAKSDWHVSDKTTVSKDSFREAVFSSASVRLIVGMLFVVILLLLFLVLNVYGQAYGAIAMPGLGGVAVQGESDMQTHVPMR